MKCPNCSQTFEEGLTKCPVCEFEIQQESPAVEPITVETEQVKDIEYYKNTYGVDNYYAKRFAKIDANNGKFVVVFNIYAFLFGAFWYLYKGMWLKALAFIVLAGAINFVSDLAVGIGVAAAASAVGTYDFYLKKVANATQTDILLSKNPNANT